MLNACPHEEGKCWIYVPLGNCRMSVVMHEGNCWINMVTNNKDIYQTSCNGSHCNTLFMLLYHLDILWLQHFFMVPLPYHATSVNTMHFFILVSSILFIQYSIQYVFICYMQTAGIKYLFPSEWPISHPSHNSTSAASLQLHFKHFIFANLLPKMKTWYMYHLITIFQ